MARTRASRPRRTVRRPRASAAGLAAGVLLTGLFGAPVHAYTAATPSPAPPVGSVPGNARDARYTP
ncbi:hypothetical protein VR44_08105, partial [Streptomyces katrae]